MLLHSLTITLCVDTYFLLHTLRSIVATDRCLKSLESFYPCRYTSNELMTTLKPKAK